MIDPNAPRAAATLLLLSAPLLAAGCAGPRTFSAQQLPRHFVATKTENVQTLDLSRLAVNTGNDELIAPGDVIEVSIAAGLNSGDATTIPSRVDDHGFATLPEIGPVRVDGLELDDAQQAIATQSIQKGLYRDPHVVVTMKQPKMFKVTVVGAVETPGPVELRPSQANLLSALVAAGSLAENAGSQIQIQQNGLATPGGTRAPLVAGTSTGGAAIGGHSLVGYEVDATPAAAGGTITVDLISATRDARINTALTDGAVVSVETVDPAKISIGGLVKNPAQFDFPVGEDLRLLQAIQMAGDTPNVMANKVYVIREVQRPGGPLERAVIETTIAKAKADDAENLRLMPGDVVSVERTPGTVLLETLRTIGFTVGARVP